MKNSRPTERALKMLIKKYPEGTLVELVKMKDDYAPPKGTREKVKYVDSYGTIFVDWETGSGLGVGYKVDKIRKV